MRIYRFVPDLAGYAHPWDTLEGWWWPHGIELGSWMQRTHDLSALGIRPSSGHYRRSPEELACSDFPALSLQLPILSERAAERLGAHPERAGSWPELARRLHPLWIGEERLFAVQPLLSTRGAPHAFLPTASEGVQLSRGDTVHYHTLAFDPGLVRGEFFTLPAHEPYAETYVTEAFVDRARAAGLTGIDHLQLVFDGRPIPPTFPPPPASALDAIQPSFRHTLEWSLFHGRGSFASYPEDELRAAFRAAVLAGLISIADRPGR